MVKKNEKVLNPYVTLGLLAGLMTLGTMALFYWISQILTYLP